MADKEACAGGERGTDYSVECGVQCMASNAQRSSGLDDIQELAITAQRGPTYLPPVTQVFLTSAPVSLLLMFVSMVCYFYSADSSVATIYILLDFALCGIPDNVLLLLWQASVRGGIIAGTLCSFCRMVWSLWQHIALNDLSGVTTTPTSSTVLASPQSCVPDNGYLETMPMMAEYNMRTNPAEPSTPEGTTAQPGGVVGTAGMDRVMVDMNIQTDVAPRSIPSPMANTSPAVNVEVKESKNLAFGITTCTGIRTDTPVGPILAAIVNDQTKNSIFTPGPAVVTSDTIQAYESATVVFLPPPVPMNVQASSTPTPVPEPLPVTAAPVLEGERKADSTIPRILGPVMVPTLESGVIDAHSSIAPRPALRLTSAPFPTSTPARPHLVVTRAPGPQHPPPFRPPGLGYQPYRYTTGPGPGSSAPTMPANQPVRSRFASLVTQSQQSVPPPCSDNPPYGKSSLFPSPLCVGGTTNPHSRQVSSAIVPVRPLTLPIKDFTAQDPFSRSLTPIRMVSSFDPVIGDSSTALAVIPSRVVPVSTAGPPCQPLPGRFRPLSISTPKPTAPVSHPPPELELWDGFRPVPSVS